MGLVPHETNHSSTARRSNDIRVWQFLENQINTNTKNVYWTSSNSIIYEKTEVIRWLDRLEEWNTTIEVRFAKDAIHIRSGTIESVLINREPSFYSIQVIQIMKTLLLLGELSFSLHTSHLIDERWLKFHKIVSIMVMRIFLQARSLPTRRLSKGKPTKQRIRELCKTILWQLWIRDPHKPIM